MLTLWACTAIGVLRQVNEHDGSSANHLCMMANFEVMASRVFKVLCPLGSSGEGHCVSTITLQGPQIYLGLPTQRDFVVSSYLSQALVGRRATSRCLRPASPATPSGDCPSTPAACASVTMMAAAPASSAWLTPAIPSMTLPTHWLLPTSGRPTPSAPSRAACCAQRCLLRSRSSEW